MPRHKQSPQQVSAMQDRILDATFLLLDDLEPEDVSIRKIADQAHISHMVIYSYFKDRDELVKALIHRQELRMSQKFDEFLADVDESNILSRLRSALLEYIEVAKSRPKLFRLLWILPVRLPEKSAHGQRFFEAQIKLLSNLFIKGMERGVFAQREPEIAALTILGVINAPMLLFYQGRMADVHLRDRVINETLDIVIHYLTGK